MDEIARLKAKFDRLIVLRDAARLKIEDELSFQRYRNLKREVVETYLALQVARRDAKQGMLD